MKRKQIDFSIQEAGYLLYVADKNLGGIPFGNLYSADWKSLTLKNALMAMSLYQDDGYNVRIRIGDLTDEEKSEWTAKAVWKLNLESGKMVVSGVTDEDLEEYMEDFPSAETDGDYHLGCFVEVPAGEYAVTIYSYPPNDLSGGWMRIEDQSSFRVCFGEDASLQFENPVDYFTRTRPTEMPPAWVKNGWEDAEFLDFLIHLTPHLTEIKIPEFESDGCILWEYRKPDICPIGIRI